MTPYEADTAAPPRPEPARPALDRDHPVPLYEQVLQQIASLIRDGTFRAGSRLPAERDLANRLGVSRVTLRRALEALVEQGLIVASPHRGWFVHVQSELMSEPPNALRSFTESGHELGLVASARVLLSTVREATLDEAETMRVAPGSEMFELERLRLLDGRPIALHSTRVPLHLAPELATTDFERASLYAVLDAAGHSPLRADCDVRAESGTERDLELLGDAPLLIVRHLTYDQRQVPVELAEVRYRGDRYALRTSLVREPRGTGETLLEPVESQTRPAQPAPAS